jgi:hypothetical protein
MKESEQVAHQLMATGWVAKNRGHARIRWMRSLNPFAHAHPALTDLRNQDVAVYLISGLSVLLMVPAGGIEPTA